MRLRYDKKTDTMQLLIKDGETSSTRALDEDVSVAYSPKDEVTAITVNNALTRIFEGLGVKLPSERKAEGEKAKGILVRVDSEKCLGFGSCVIVAPSVFRLDERPGRGTFQSMAKLDVLDESGGEDFQNLLTAAQSCPTQAIVIEDRKTGRRIYPP